MIPHFLQLDVDVHLAIRNLDERIYKVKVRQLAIYSVVHDMVASEVFDGVVDDYGALEYARLDGKRFDIGFLRVVICINPGLRTGSTVFGYQEDYVLRP
jgi:hypothetical protein